MSALPPPLRLETNVEDDLACTGLPRASSIPACERAGPFSACADPGTALDELEMRQAEEAAHQGEAPSASLDPTPSALRQAGLRGTHSGPAPHVEPESAAALPSRWHARRANSAGTAGFDDVRLTELQHAQEDIELRILMERLQLLKTQRELAAVKCERFTSMLDKFVEKQAARTADDAHLATEPRCSSPREGAFLERSVPLSLLSTPPLIPRSSTHHQRHRRHASLVLADPVSQTSSRRQSNGASKHRRQCSLGSTDGVKGKTPTRHMDWRSPEFSGLWSAGSLESDCGNIK